jgi:hypothetical protein
VWNLKILCLTSCHNFMANSPLVAIDDRVAHPGSRRCSAVFSHTEITWSASTTLTRAWEPPYTTVGEIPGDFLYVRHATEKTFQAEFLLKFLETFFQCVNFRKSLHGSCGEPQITGRCGPWERVVLRLKLQVKENTSSVFLSLDTKKRTVVSFYTTSL